MKYMVGILFLISLIQADIDIARLKHQVLTVPRLKECPMLAQHFIAPGRTLRGHTAAAHQFPYQAALFIDATKFCGASLISRKYILTAAHCTKGAKSIDVILGAHNIYAPELTQVRITSTVFKVHKGWNPDTLVNDIALVQLPHDAPLSAAIATIQLPAWSDVDNYFVGCMSIVSGWGKSSDQQTGITEVLQYVETQIITNAKCAQYFGNYITESNLCASGEGKKSTCNGDSGGPMVIKLDGKMIQVGITSFVSGAGCEAGYPHAYTRLTKFLRWIQAHSDVRIRY